MEYKITLIYFYAKWCWVKSSYLWAKVYGKLVRIEMSKSKLPYNISRVHKQWANDYIIKNAATLITITSLKIYLEGIDNQRKLSESGVRHLLKNVLKYSNKSAHKLWK